MTIGYTIHVGIASSKSLPAHTRQDDTLLSIFLAMCADFAAAPLGVQSGVHLNPTTLQHLVSERLMFHFSGREAVAEICSSGFDPRLWQSNSYGRVRIWMNLICRFRRDCTFELFCLIPRQSFRI